jgi:transcriptional regulator with XRE-family HTH domain
MRKSVDHPAYPVLLDLLKEARRKAGLTQQQVADALGEPQSFAAKYERGERRLDVIELFVILRVLGAEPIKLVRLLDRAIRAAD